MNRTAIVTLAVAVATAGLTGCDPGPKCLESHTETRIVTTYVSKPGGRIEPLIRAEVVTVCDKYETKKTA